MELYQLRQFQAAARHKNMTRAASESLGDAGEIH
jgi:DNA-binding transcriptional LysR family regulator